MDDRITRLRDNISRVYLGNPEAVDSVLCCLLARGHALLEDVPGVGKTALAMAVARSVECPFSRIQLTPDMLPSDVLGVSVLNRETGAFEFRPGPIFASVVLADEINRTTPRTQTALLEAMNESSVSIDGVVHDLGRPFMLLATQNPYDFEGTYPLPENQLDRFLMRIRVGYPDAATERDILRLRPAQSVLGDLEPVMRRDELIALQDDVDDVRLADELMDYIVEIARATREDDDVRVGLSPRGSLALAQAARATAMLKGRDYVVPEDITGNVEPVCAHRIMARAGSLDAGVGAPPGLLDRVLAHVPSPV